MDDHKKLIEELREESRNPDYYSDNRPLFAARLLTQAANALEGLVGERDEAVRHMNAHHETACRISVYRDELEARATAAEAQRDGYKYHLDQCEQIAGKVLGYPWFKDDQKNFPGATEADGVCIGEHVGDSIVEELANRLKELREAPFVISFTARELQDAIERVILRRLHEKRIDGYTLEMAQEIANLSPPDDGGASVSSRSLGEGGFSSAVAESAGEGLRPFASESQRKSEGSS